MNQRIIPDAIEQDKGDDGNVDADTNQLQAHLTGGQIGNQMLQCMLDTQQPSHRISL